MSPLRDRSYLDKKGNLPLWFALAAPPAIWFVAQTISYFMVPWACSHQSTWPLHLTVLPALAIALVAGYTSYVIWRDAGARWSDDIADREDRSRFLAELAIGGSALFALLLIGQWVAVIILGPCIPLPRVPFTPDAMIGAGQILFAHVGAPLAPHDLWTAWSADPAIVLSLLWGGVFYGAGFRYAPGRIRVRAFAFACGCVVLALALLSPLHALSEVLFSAHMAQHTLLIVVAAPLIVIGRPVLVTLWALPRSTRRAVTSHRAARMLAHVARMTPAQAFVLHGVTLWVWHLPALYQASLTSDLVHAIQHASFLLTAIAFWAALFDVRRSGWSYGSGVLYVFGTAVHTSILGALMTLAPVGWYPRYADTTQQWGLSPLEDQQLAGLIMWVPAGLLYTVVALILLAAWLRASETRVRRPRWVTTVVLCGVLLAGACDWPPGVTRQALDARSAAGLTGGASSEGRRTIERYGCGGCHTISGIRGANGLVGPPLNGIGKRLYIGGVITNTPENMARWIQDPKAVDSLTVMPRLGVTLDQARDITAYLYTLK